MPILPRIIQAPVQTVRADASIAECIRIMRDQNIGALLVVSDDDHGDLVGIFTERDLLRHIELIQNGEHWNRAVRTVMTKTLRYVHSERLGEAARLMLKYHIRHLPVVTEINNRNRAVGMISMRDLFYHWMERYTKDIASAFIPERENSSDPSLELGMLSKDPVLNKFLADSLSHAPHIKLKRFYARHFAQSATIPSTIYKLRTFIIDLDHQKFEVWSKIVSALCKDKRVPQIILIYDPAQHKSEKLVELDKIKKMEKFSLFTKPIAVGELLRKLSRALGNEIA